MQDDKMQERKPLYGPEGVYGGYGGYMLKTVAVWLFVVGGALMFFGGIIGDEAGTGMGGFFNMLIGWGISRIPTRQPPPPDDGEPGPTG